MDVLGEIDLSNNKLTCASLENGFSNLQLPSLKFLNLSQNKIKSQGAKSLLTNLTHLHRVDLSQNRIEAHFGPWLLRQ